MRMLKGLWKVLHPSKTESLAHLAYHGREEIYPLSVSISIRSKRSLGFADWVWLSKRCRWTGLDGEQSAFSVSEDGSALEQLAKGCAEFSMVGSSWKRSWGFRKIMFQCWQQLFGGSSKTLFYRGKTSWSLSDHFWCCRLWILAFTSKKQPDLCMTACLDAFCGSGPGYSQVSCLWMTR